MRRFNKWQRQQQTTAQKVQLLVVLLISALLQLVPSSSVATTTNDKQAMLKEQEESTTIQQRNWFLGLSFSSMHREQFNVFDRDYLPPEKIDSWGHGTGLKIGRRIGERFLLDIHLLANRFETIDDQVNVNNGDALFQGTVLFLKNSAFQPFLRGGIGFSAYFIVDNDDYHYALGTSAIGGGGFYLHLSSRFSFEFEVCASFVNYVQAHSDYDNQSDSETEDDRWEVHTSSEGVRFVSGVSFWF